MLSYQIQPMTEKWAQAMAELETHCFSLPWSVDMCRGELTNPISCYFCALDHTASVLLGYAGMQIIVDEGYITNLAVAEDARGSGLGRRLLRALIEEGRTRKLAFMTLEARVSNIPALALYERMGFVLAGRRKGYYEKPKEDAYLLTLRLENE